ncbi:PLP-dependent transferase [Marinicella sp. S1101]|uniref:PLP-dependent transferase n=1 Tax=Marinicella marina TaxID=2996016 RepID=UPI002260B109|nr:PLP-dependent transferase [Marinicella marina]MCX7554903.1 PLP-dependent transferase [Marinicella marina]MDJ1141273.1 PLP-dependent transferase [Marinicella marina]
MKANTAMLESLKTLLENIPQDWIELTTHRLDIYNEAAAKTEFLEGMQTLLASGDTATKSLAQLPTAYDYIRLGHQLSSVLEWVLADINQVSPDQVISFASSTMPLLALLRSNKLANQTTHIYYDGAHAPLLDEARLHQVYGYQYQLTQVNRLEEVPAIPDTTQVFVTQQPFEQPLPHADHIDATININPTYGAYVIIHGGNHSATVDAVQHVRRRETTAMSPKHCLHVLKTMVGAESESIKLSEKAALTVAQCINKNTGSQSQPLVASSGLSIQYAILMGLIEHAKTEYPEKPIRIILPPNCYGGTNDQSRRVAALIPEVEIMDLLVDGGADLVTSLEGILRQVAEIDGVPLVLAEIPTNPRVEVPDMLLLGETLTTVRQTPDEKTAIPAVFIVDQTFCPNVKLLHQQSELDGVKTISFSSGSKFPSGGRCIAGYCAANQAATALMPLIESHLLLSDNVADDNQMNILAETMPSMPERIAQAYEKTREMVDQVKLMLPNSKTFYVTDEIARRGFTPSVFSLDLPVHAESNEERQALQKQMNKKLIEFMINRHPDDCKNCVSYGQLKGSYWTIPATSTQGTTKEADKDYVVRVSLSPEVDVDVLLQSLKEFCLQHGLL